MLNLYRHFKKFEESEMIGVANDLSPHYLNLLKSYRKKNPETLAGNPGRFQVCLECAFVLDTSLQSISSGIQHWCDLIQPCQDEEQSYL